MSSDIFNITCAISQGDEEAFLRFYQAYSNRMYGYIFVLSRGNESIACDIHQEALLKTIRYMKPFDDEDKLWCWLVRLMKTAFIDFLRKNKKHAACLELQKDFASDGNERDLQEGNYVGRMLQCLSDALKELSDEDRLLVEAYYFEGKSQLALAEEIKSTPKALGMKFIRIRDKLKSSIAGKLKNE